MMKIKFYSFIFIVILLTINAHCIDYNLKNDYMLSETNFISSSLNNISFSPNGKFFAISSVGNSMFGLYSNDNKTLIRTIDLPIGVTDTVASQLNKRTNILYSKYNYYSVENIQETVSREIPLYAYKNVCAYIEFINDSLICALAQIQILKYPKDVEKIAYRQLNFKIIPTLIFYDIKNDISVVHTILDKTTDDTLSFINFVQFKNMSIDTRNQFIYIIARGSYFSPTKYDDPDTCVSIAKVDYFGNYIKDVHFLPERYMIGNIRYDLDYKAKMCILDDTMYAVYPPIVDSIFLFHKGELLNRIFVKGFDNSMFFDSLVYFKKAQKSIFNNQKYLRQFVNFTFEDIYLINKNLLLLHILKKDTLDTINMLSHYILFLNRQGKLIKEEKIENNNNNGKFTLMHYSKVTDLIYIIRKKDNNWYFEEFKY